MVSELSIAQGTGFVIKLVVKSVLNTTNIAALGEIGTAVEPVACVGSFFGSPKYHFAATSGPAQGSNFLR